MEEAMRKAMPRAGRHGLAHFSFRAFRENFGALSGVKFRVTRQLGRPCSGRALEGALEGSAEAGGESGDLAVCAVEGARVAREELEVSLGRLRAPVVPVREAGGHCVQAEGQRHAGVVEDAPRSAVCRFAAGFE